MLDGRRSCPLPKALRFGAPPFFYLNHLLSDVFRAEPGRATRPRTRKIEGLFL